VLSGHQADPGWGSSFSASSRMPGTRGSICLGPWGMTIPNSA